MKEKDFAGFSERLQSIRSPAVAFETLGMIGPYPLYCANLKGRGNSRAKVLLAAGMHGDEPAGPEAALQFLERENGDWLRQFDFMVLPCINPWGWVRRNRENGEGLDLNRAFLRKDVREVGFIRNLLQHHRFEFVIDFHEDWEATGFYLYEAQKEDRWIGSRITERVKRIMPLDNLSTESEIPIAYGVSMIDPAWGIQGLTSFTFQYHTDRVVLTETPTSRPLESRVAAHLTALDTILDYHRK